MFIDWVLFICGISEYYLVMMLLKKFFILDKLINVMFMKLFLLLGLLLYIVSFIWVKFNCFIVILKWNILLNGKFGLSLFVSDNMSKIRNFCWCVDFYWERFYFRIFVYVIDDVGIFLIES